MKEKSDCCPFCNKETLYANPKVGCDNPKCECHKTPPMDLAAGKKWVKCEKHGKGIAKKSKKVATTTVQIAPGIEKEVSVSASVPCDGINGC